MCATHRVQVDSKLTLAYCPDSKFDQVCGGDQNGWLDDLPTADERQRLGTDALQSLHITQKRWGDFIGAKHAVMRSQKRGSGDIEQGLGSVNLN